MILFETQMLSFPIKQHYFHFQFLIYWVLGNRFQLIPKMLVYFLDLSLNTSLLLSWGIGLCAEDKEPLEFIVNNRHQPCVYHHQWSFLSTFQKESLLKPKFLFSHYKYYANETLEPYRKENLHYTFEEVLRIHEYHSIHNQ